MTPPRSSSGSPDARHVMLELRHAFDGADVVVKNLMLRKAHDCIEGLLDLAQAAPEPVAWRWKWAPNDFWKYTDRDGPGAPDMAQLVEPLAVPSTNQLSPDRDDARARFLADRADTERKTLSNPSSQVSSTKLEPLPTDRYAVDDPWCRPVPPAHRGDAA